MLPGAASSVHYTVGSDAIHGLEGKRMGLFYQAGTDGILVYRIFCLP